MCENDLISRSSAQSNKQVLSQLKKLRTLIPLLTTPYQWLTDHFFFCSYKQAWRNIYKLSHSYSSKTLITSLTSVNRIFILTFSSKLSIKIVCSAWSGTWIFSMALESKDLGAITMRSATWL